MKEVASARLASVMESQDIKLELIKANIVAKKTKEDHPARRHKWHGR
jgi:hypothetical protein